MKSKYGNIHRCVFSIQRLENNIYNTIKITPICIRHYKTVKITPFCIQHYKNVNYIYTPLPTEPLSFHILCCEVGVKGCRCDGQCPTMKIYSTKILDDNRSCSTYLKPISNCCHIWHSGTHTNNLQTMSRISLTAAHA